MKLMFIFPPVVLFAVLPIVALATNSVLLPKTAKPLTKAEIVAIYGGKTAEWNHPNTDHTTGTATWDAAVSVSSGTWKAGKNHGEWDSKVTWKGDQYCYEAKGKDKKKYNKMVCNLVFQDVDGIVYEVDPKTKKVISTDKLVK